MSEEAMDEGLKVCVEVGSGRFFFFMLELEWEVILIW